MPITVTNRRPVGPLLVPLTSGGSVRLSPGETSLELPDVAAANNAPLDSLVRQGMAEVRTVGADHDDAAPARRASRRGRRRVTTGNESTEPADVGEPDAVATSDAGVSDADTPAE